MPVEASYYLDTSALVKRYVEKTYSDKVDQLFSQAYKEIGVISLSHWDIGGSGGIRHVPEEDRGRY